MIDRTGKIVLVNAQIERLLGYDRKELIGQPVEMLVPERFQARHPSFRIGYFNDPKSRSMGAGRDLFGLRKDGSELPIEIGLNPLRTPDGDFVLSSIVDITERRRSGEQFRLALEAASTGMIMIDASGKIVLVNARVERLFGYDRSELIGEPMEMLVSERFRARHPGFRMGFLKDPKSRSMGAGRDLFGLHKDGSELPIEIGLNPLRTPDGDFVLSSIVDIAERKRAEKERDKLLGQLKTLNVELEERVRVRTTELTSTLREREVLLQEIHHRVKNNLYIISSLVEMQARRMEGEASRAALLECQTRIQAIALIHEKLYQSRDYSRIPFSEYASSLAADIFAATGSRSDVSLALDIDGVVSLPVNKAIPCGLILNELITNALKHAFPPGRGGNIRVELSAVEAEQLRLVVEDDGVGMLDEAAVRKSDSLGLQLVCTLAEQLDGKLEVLRTGGTRFQITFPAEE